MTTTLRIVKYELRGVLRSRWLLAYGLCFALATELLLRFSNGGPKALLGLMNVVLIVIPLVSIVFGTIYSYDGRGFTELLLAQPVRRRQLFAAQYLGLCVPLALAFIAGAAAPALLRGASTVPAGTLASILFAGVALTGVFAALALLIATRCNDKVRGIGLAVGLWFLLSVAYDALVLTLALTFANYPIERAMIGVMVANPIDMARVVLLLQFDVAALMGYTGAVFKHFFGSAVGPIVASLVLAAWIAGPLSLAARWFHRKDF